MAKDWFAVLRRASVSRGELGEAYLRILETATEWVPVAKIVEECRDVRRERTPYAPPIEPPTGSKITREERDEILRSLKNPAFALEVIEGRGESRRYTISEDEVIITDEDIARREEQKRRMVEGRQ